MKKLIQHIILLAAFFVANVSYALDTPMMGGGTTVPSSSVPQYTYASGNLLTWNNTETATRNVIPIAGVGKTLYVELATAPGAGASWAFTLVLNGSDTTSTCTIADSATTCNDVTHTFNIAANDKVSFKSVPTNTPAAPGQFRFGWLVDSTTEGEGFITGSSRATTVSNSATEFNGLQGCAAGNATEANRDQVMPAPGVISKLHVDLNGAPAAGKSYAVTIRKAGADQTLTCTVSDSGTNCSDASNSFSVVAGDIVSVKFVPTGTPTAQIARWAMRWVPTTDGNAVILGSGGGNMNTAGSVRYLPVSGTTQTWGSTEANMVSLSPGFLFKDFYIALSAAPAGAASYLIRPRIAGADGTTNVTITGAATTGNDTSNSDAIAAGARLNMSSLSASSPAAAAAKWGFVAYIDPSGATPTPTPTATSTATSTNTPTPTATPVLSPLTCTKVTNLNDSGAGSFRECMESVDPRWCVPEISGRVALTTAIKVKSDKFLSGSTAPGRVMFTNSGFYVRGSNIDLQNIEIRPGDATTGESIDSRDALRVEQTAGALSNIRLKWLSVSWATDEVFSIFGDVEHVFLEDSILSEGLDFAGHSDVNHSSGCILWDPGSNYSLRRNIFASNKDRNCLQKPNTHVDFGENIVYNWGASNSNAWHLPSAVGTPGQELNYFANSYIAGPASNASTGPGVYADSTPGPGAKIYLDDSIGPTRLGTPTPQIAIALNVPTQFFMVSASGVIAPTPMARATAQAYTLENAGSRRWERNSTDARIVSAVKTPFASQTPAALGIVDCVENCDSAAGHTDTPVPEGGYPSIATAIATVPCSSTPYTRAQIITFLESYEGTATPTPTITPTPTVTPTPTETNTPAPTPTGRYMRCSLGASGVTKSPAGAEVSMLGDCSLTN